MNSHLISIIMKGFIKLIWSYNVLKQFIKCKLWLNNLLEREENNLLSKRNVVVFVSFSTTNVKIIWGFPKMLFPNNRFLSCQLVRKSPASPLSHPDIPYVSRYRPSPLYLLPRSVPRSQGATHSFSLALLRMVSGSGKECRTIAPYRPYSAMIVDRPQHFSVLRHFARRFWNQTWKIYIFNFRNFVLLIQTSTVKYLFIILLT